MFQFRFIDSWSLIGNINEDEGKLLWVLPSQNRGSNLLSSLFTLPHIYCFPPPLSPHFNGFRYTATTAFFNCFLYITTSFILLFSPATSTNSTAFLLFSLHHHISFVSLQRHISFSSSSFFNTSLFLDLYPLLYFSCPPSSSLSLAFSLL